VKQSSEGTPNPAFAVQHGTAHGLVELAVQGHIVLLAQACHFGEQ
jgi:hypothetical protein